MNNKSYIYKIITLGLLLFAQMAWGGNEKRIKGLKGSQLTTGAELFLEDYRFQDMIFNANYEHQYFQDYAHVYVKLVDENNEFAHYTSDWTLSVQYELKLKNAANIESTFVETVDIKYNQSTDFYDQMTKKYEDYYSATLKVLNVTASSGVNLSSVRLDLILDIERTYVLDDDLLPVLSIKNSSSYGFSGPDKDNLEIRWTPVQGAEYYDLEWLFLEFPEVPSSIESDHYPISGVPVDIADLNIDFKNATRIRLSDNFYDLNLNYPRGYMLYRVRTVGENRHGQSITGDWTVAATHADLNGSNPEKCIAYKGNSSDLNWQYTAVYAEDGKRKELVSYFDGSLRSRQSLSVLNSDNNVVADGVIMDQEGREVLTVLPSVVSGTSLAYRNGLNKNTNGDLYSWQDFDQGTYVLNPKAMGTTSAGAGKYYSPSNSISTVGKDLIPDAEGYPFSRVILSDDGLNRPIRSSGIGSEFKLGSDRDVENMYLSPAGSEELDKVFGSEVGTTGYTKRLRIDQNEQIYVEYFDQDNRLIASSIVADIYETKNLKALDTTVYPLMDIQSIKSDLLETGNVLTDLTWESVNVVSPEITNTYNFNYEFLSTQYNAEVCNNPLFATDQTVPYDLLIYILDQDGNHVTLTFDDLTTTNVISLNQIGTHQTSFFAEFELLNTYYITKKLVIDSAYVSANIASELSNTSLLCNNIQEPYLIFGCVMNCMYDNGYVPVYDLQGSILHYKHMDDATDIIQLNDPMHQACLLVTDCDDIPLNSAGRCAQKRTLMLEGMKPEGEYFDNLPDKNTITYDHLAWLNANASMSSPPLAAAGFLSTFGGNWALFKDAVTTFENNGNSFAGTTYASGYPNIVSFFSTWDNESWENTLFRVHPEHDVFDCLCTPLLLEITGGNFVEVNYPVFDRFYNYFYTVDNDIDAIANGAFNPFGYNQTLNIPPADYLNWNPTTPLSLSEIWSAGFGTTSSTPNYLVDTFLIEGVQFFDATMTPIINRPLHEDNYISKVYNSLSNITTLSGGAVSVWDILAKSFEMSSTPGFTSSITTSDIAGNGVLKMLLGTDGILNPTSDYFTPRSRIDYFRSQYYLYRELHWYDRIRNRANDLVSGSDPYYFDQNGSDFTILFPDQSIYNDILLGVDPTLAFAVDSFTNCTQQAELWAETVVNSLRGNYPPGLYDRFNDYQDLIDQYPIAPNSTPGSDYQNAMDFINAEIQLIDDLTAEFISKECNPYISQPTSFLSSPITSSTFNIAITASGSNPNNFIISPLTGSSANDTLLAFTYPMGSGVNTTFGSGPALQNYTPEELANCGCNTYEDYLVANGLTTASDADIATSLVSNGIITSISEFSPHWKTYCNLSSTNVLDYLFVSGFPEDFHCVPYPQLAFYKHEYVVSNNIYQTEYLQYQIDSAAAYGTLTGYILDSVVNQSLQDVHEEFTMIQPPSMFHYTLFYYDQAGNLMKTVPPKGVASTYEFELIDSIRANKLDHLYPEHDYITNYKYNSLNQLTEQTTPDGGRTQFWYDQLGRLILSQNSKQVTENKYSYVLYDQLSRAIESGQVIANVPLDEDRDLSTKPITLLGSFNEDYSMLTPFYIWLQMNEREQFTQSIYDRVLSSSLVDGFFPRPDGSFGQENLRLRISSITYKHIPEDGLLVSSFPTIDDVYSLIDANLAGNSTNINTALVSKMQIDDWKYLSYDNASFYSYDIHGNVKRLVQNNLDFFTTNYNVKSLDYSYDLISGNVNQVIYQAGASDQFSHRYFYDADNRLTEVETSNDLHTWQTQAKYFYYAHGPLARVEIGDKQVQANDYAYTLQGWLKSVNGASLLTADDPGDDAQVSLTNKHRQFAKDVFGYNLHYFDGDYSPIGGNENHIMAYDPQDNLGDLEQYRNLYNGNITSMVTTIQDAGVQSTRYSYDQLNRIKTMDVYTPTTTNINNHTPLDQTNHSFNYQSAYSYDPDGNILSLSRKNESNTLIDDLNYSYYQDGINNTNRLKLVNDATPDGASTTNTGDFQDDSFSGSQMFEYDNLGNLTKDYLEEIEEIQWSNLGKVLSITRQSGSTQSDLVFEYDALGNRLSKLEKTKDGSGNLEAQSQWKKTIYVRDASGNVMATYKGEAGNPVYKVKDFHIYGSERLGVANVNDNNQPNALISTQKRTLGQTNYELKNHLGNVLATVSDAKRSVLTGNDVSYKSELKSYSDYYPFGMQMPGRKFNGGDYKYGFNGMENDNEVKGNGNSVDFEARMYDPRLGRWQAMDPLAAKFSSHSPYNFVLNTPLNAIDPDGRDVIFVNGWRMFKSDESDKGISNEEQNEARDNYWNNVNAGFTNMISEYFNDFNQIFLNGSDGDGSFARNRITEGKYMARQLVESGILELDPNTPVTLVGHSQGNAYAAGMAEEIMNLADEKGIKVDVNMVMLAVHQPKDISVSSDINAIQFTYNNDNSRWVKPMAINGASVWGVVNANPDNLDWVEDGRAAHSAPVDDNAAFELIMATDRRLNIFKKKKNSTNNTSDEENSNEDAPNEGGTTNQSFGVGGAMFN